MSAYTQASKPLSTRSVVLGIIVGLHVLLVLGLTNALAVKKLPFVETVTTIFNIEEEHPPMKNVVPLKPEVELQAPMEVELPPPEVPVVLEQEVAPPITDAAAVGDPAPPSDVLSYTATRSPDAYYPPLSIQMAESGTAVVNVCVNGDGSRDGAPTLQTTSGYPRLDEAAIKWATEALRFKPARNGDAGVHACKGFRVKFRLQNVRR